MGIVRKTKSVEVLLDVFAKSAGALSVVALVQQLSTQMNKATIYRILDKLEEDVMLHSFLDKDGLKWYAKCEGCTSSSHHDVHPHFQCRVCGTVDCVPQNVQIPKIPNRKIDAVQVLLLGTCEECC